MGAPTATGRLAHTATRALGRVASAAVLVLVLARCGGGGCEGIACLFTLDPAETRNALPDKTKFCLHFAGTNLADHGAPFRVR